MDYENYLKGKTKDELIKIIMQSRYGTKVVSTEFKRKVAFQICYDGQSYNGLVSQKNQRTIEDFIRAALYNSNLGSIDTKIVFAGRTDKGVSATGMVFTTIVRSLKNQEITGGITFLDEGDIHCEFNYDKILNSHLPIDIRVIGWCPVAWDFCARKSCILRSYKYFFLKKDLNITAMKEACSALKGGKNFKNLSKKPTRKEYQKILDPESHFKRPLNDIYIEECMEYCILNVNSKSFLHNMVRKIFWLLKEIGSGRRNLDFIESIFSNTKVGCGTESPQFLVFSQASYEKDLEFGSSEKNSSFIEDMMLKNLVKRYLMTKILYKNR